MKPVYSSGKLGLLEPEFGNLYVTPPNIDELIGNLSFTISEGIHKAVFP